MRKQIRWLLILMLCISNIDLANTLMPNLFYKKFDFGDKIFAVIEDKYDFKDEIKIIDREFYVPIGLIKNYIDPYIFCDRKENKIIITDDNKVIKLKLNDFGYELNENKVRDFDVNIKKDGYKFYLPSRFLSKIYDLNISHEKKYNLLKIDFKKQTYIKGEIKKNCSMRYEADRKSFKAQKILKGERVRIYGEKNKYLKIRLGNGLVGYVKRKYVINKEKISGEKKLSVKKENKEKIRMVWDSIYNQTANYYALQKDFNDKINLVSPTWFFFDKESLNGELVNFIDINYVKKAHENGIKICPTLSDELDYDLNHKIITDSNNREFVIREIINFIDKYNLDGINIDFEGVKRKDINFYIEFLRELKPLLKERNVILIIDVFVPDTWSMYYNRAEIGKIADYVCVMAYDEYNSSSDVPGPVASYDFVLNGIEKTLEEVPKEKIIIGLPFYNRIWHVKNNNKFKIENVSMQMGFDFFKKRNVEFKWLDDKKYFYCEYTDGDVFYKSWLENEDSIEEKLKLIKKFDLAGVAGWRRGFEKKIIWDIIFNYIN